MVSQVDPERSLVEQKNQGADADIPVRLRSLVSGASYGFTLSLFTATVVAASIAYDEGKASARFYALLGGFVTVFAAPWIGRYCSTRTTFQVLGGVAGLAVAFVSALYLLSAPTVVVSGRGATPPQCRTEARRRVFRGCAGARSGAADRPSPIGRYCAGARNIRAGPRTPACRLRS